MNTEKNSPADKIVGSSDGLERRSDRQPALFLIANHICCTDLTTGFCSPQNKEVCECWNRAQNFLRGSGLSAQACVWVLQNRRKIEKAAENDVSF